MEFTTKYSLKIVSTNPAGTISIIFNKKRKALRAVRAISESPNIFYRLIEHIRGESFAGNCESYNILKDTFPK